MELSRLINSVLLLWFAVAVIICWLNDYRLEEAILHLLWGLVDMFFGYNFPKLEPVWMKSAI